MTTLIRTAPPIGLQTPTFAMIRIVMPEDWETLIKDFKVLYDGKKEYIVEGNVLYYFERDE